MCHSVKDLYTISLNAWRHPRLLDWAGNCCEGPCVQHKSSTYVCWKQDNLPWWRNIGLIKYKGIVVSNRVNPIIKCNSKNKRHARAKGNLGGELIVRVIEQSFILFADVSWTLNPQHCVYQNTKEEEINRLH